jgi:ribosomal protein S18 acetylase RimI-like enzyme
VSHRALNPEQFHYVFKKATPREMGGSSHHEVRAYGGGGATNVGMIMWHHKTGEIGNIATSPEVRRQGIATAVYRHAQGIAAETRGVRPPRHSSDRTGEGEAWARSLGERLPKRLRIDATAGDWEPA